MTHPESVVIEGSGVPEVEQEFDVEVGRHLARLEADRAANQPANEPANQPVTPAEERTKVSDVRHAVAEEVAAVRRGLRNYGSLRERAVTEAEFNALKADQTRALSETLLGDLHARLDRIEQWTRGRL